MQLIEFANNVQENVYVVWYEHTYGPLREKSTNPVAEWSWRSSVHHSGHTRERHLKA